MNTSILRSVRFAFVTLLLGLTAFTVAESALGRDHAGARAAAEGLSTCGSEARPCALAAMVVTHEPAEAVADEGLAACGSADEPCVLEAVAVKAERGTGRLASADRAPRMMVRAGS